MRGTIGTKRWDDPRDPSDGRRILVCRYRPRGLPKSDETWDEWLSDLGPSVELHAAAYGKGRLPLAWNAYRARYLAEIRQQRDLIRALAERVAAGESLTVLCSSSCVQESRCHRSLLRELIEAHVGRLLLPDGRY